MHDANIICKAGMYFFNESGVPSVHSCRGADAAAAAEHGKFGSVPLLCVDPTKWYVAAVAKRVERYSYGIHTFSVRASYPVTKSFSFSGVILTVLVFTPAKLGTNTCLQNGAYLIYQRHGRGKQREGNSAEEQHLLVILVANGLVDHSTSIIQHQNNLRHRYVFIFSMPCIIARKCERHRELPTDTINYESLERPEYVEIRRLLTENLYKRTLLRAE